ncbi:hypothetical protein X275_00380 [Marinitoga sp. 1197]|uniref:fibronectin type III domain-containing protein n=1 Tax=Marinitoga sp. 1197 TaxID=1428449 RepID=UPI00064136C7|nr:fibronectin type III domain-containing protein [Marinitoga sp. 1197]KLO24286.1 hypothetical protein X275_00380 [Marinitoga sp. 1197]
MKKIIEIFLLIIFISLISTAFSNIIWEISPYNFEVIDYNKNLTLSWSLDKKANYYSIYFGENKKNLKLIYNGEKTEYTIKELKPNKNYYWKIKVYTDNEIIESEIFKFYLQLKKPEIKDVFPNFQYNIDSKNVKFSWKIDYSIKYNIEFILYKNDIKVIDKQINTNTYIMNLSPGTKYKWYLKLKDKFNNKYIFGPYIFSTKPHEFIMSIKNRIYKIKTYGDYIEKTLLYNSEYKIEKIQKYENFIILKTKNGIDIIHKTGRVTSKIDIKNILDFFVEKKDKELLLYIVDGESLRVFDITNPYYPFLKKRIIGKFASISANENSIILLMKSKILLMNKKFKIYYQKNLEKPKKIIYNDNKTLIILSADKLIKFNYKNNILYFDRELNFSGIIDYSVYKKKIAFLTINNEIYIYDTDFHLINYRYFTEKIEKIKLYTDYIYKISEELKIIDIVCLKSFK